MAEKVGMPRNWNNQSLTYLQLSIKIFLDKRLDAGDGQIEGMWTILHEVFFQQDKTQSWTVFWFQTKELENTKIVIVIDINVDEKNL